MGFHFNSGMTMAAVISIVFLFTGLNSAKSLVADNITKVELDIFSGKKNPIWNLSENESRYFISEFRSLPEMKENQSVGSGLGYRGFIIRGSSVKEEGFEEIRVYSGAVRAMAANYTRNLSDQKRSLEHWLIGTVQNYIDKNLFDYIQEEIAKGS